MFDVQVCATVSWLVTVTVVPAAMTSVDGRNAKLRIASGATFVAVDVVVVGAVVCGVVSDGGVTTVEVGGIGDGGGEGGGDGPGAGEEVGGAMACPEPTGDGDGATTDGGLLGAVVFGLLTTVVLVVRVVLVTGFPTVRPAARVPL